ncbi:hypothetical protein MTO96_015823 [Rhipicephalus appendiculatus]
MDEVDEWGARRRRPGLRALAEAREMGTHSHRRSRADIRARRRSSISRIGLQQLPAADEHISDQRNELFSCIFLFCCGILACKYLIIEQYQINRRRQEATTPAPLKPQEFQPDVVSPTLNQHPVVPFPAICVYAETLRPSTPMPQDGLCDYMFFDSFYKSGANKIDKTAVNSASLDTFLKLSRESAYAITQMGIGFAQYGASEALRVINTDEGDAYMLELWKVQKVRHYGVLDVDARASNMEDVLNLLQALRFQQQLSLEDEQGAQKPTAYIVVGVDVVKFLHEKRHLFASSSVAISISMKARWYRPRDADPHWYFDWLAVRWIYPYPGYQPGQLCTSLGDKEYFTSYFYVCSADEHFKDRLRRIAGDRQFMHTFSESYSLVLTYDNVATIQTKYCDLREILNGFAYGIAIFDADQDAWDKNPCVGTPRNFDRMNMVRKLMDHVSKPGREHYPEGCWSLS